MYYEEQLINGIAYFRTTPSGHWRQMDIKTLSEKYFAAKEILKAASYYAAITDEESAT